MVSIFLKISSFAILFWIVFSPNTCASQGIIDRKEGIQLMPHVSGKDSSFNWQPVRLKTYFPSRKEALAYLSAIPALFSDYGFLAASVDSVWENAGIIHVMIFPGPLIRWGQLDAAALDKNALGASGLNTVLLKGKPVNVSYIKRVQEGLLKYYQDHGYPFARIQLDSVRITQDSMYARLYADRSAYYLIDSIRLFGKARISKSFLSHYLAIDEHAPYAAGKLAQVDRRLAEISFLKSLQPSDLQMLGTGAVLNLYLDPQKSSRVNFLVGFLPGDGKGKKTQITGDLLLDLKNTFGKGESMLVNWQQLQPRSPRLNLGFNQPFIFNTSVGFDFAFDLFRKDSNFLQINTLAGIEYAAGTLHKGKIYLQWQDNKLLEGGMDTSYVKINKQLPPNIDMRAANLGMQYERQATNFRPNPRRGHEWMINISAGIKKIRPNDQILDLKEAAFDYASLYDSIRLSSYLLRIKGGAAGYFPLGRASVLKVSFQGGLFQSPDIFRNELFQIGGFRLLRGFDEESIYSTRYAVLTFEYRYLLGERSYLYGFSDAAVSRNKHQEINVSNQFLSGGLGINFQTGQGMLSVCYAAGYRNDVTFRLTQASKLHFGYYYYF